jgi:hypothetical protein
MIAQNCEEQAEYDGYSIVLSSLRTGSKYNQRAPQDVG